MQSKLLEAGQVNLVKIFAKLEIDAKPELIHCKTSASLNVPKTLRLLQVDKNVSLVHQIIIFFQIFH